MRVTSIFGAITEVLGKNKEKRRIFHFSVFFPVSERRSAFKVHAKRKN